MSNSVSRAWLQVHLPDGYSKPAMTCCPTGGWRCQKEEACEPVTQEVKLEEVSRAAGRVRVCTQRNSASLVVYFDFVRRHPEFVASYKLHLLLRKLLRCRSARC